MSGTPTILAALLAGVILLWVSALNWRVSVKTALYVVVLEGALRKWVLPQASELIYFLKDDILLGAYIGYLARERFPFRALIAKGGGTGWLLALALILVFEILNPALNSVLVGLLGAKGYLLYVPLAFLLPDLFRSTEELQRFLRRYLLFCIPICILGVAQFYAPADSAINIYAKSEVEVQVVEFEEGNVRVTGTFPYLAGYAVYLTMSFALVFALLIHQRRWAWKSTLGVALVLIVANSFMTGSRGVVLAALILLMGFVLFSIFERSARSRLLSLVLVVACGIGGLVSAKAFPTAVDAFLSRAGGQSDSIIERIGKGFAEPFQVLNVTGLGGFGAGATQVACFALRDQLRLGPPATYPPPAEGEMLRVMLELGPFGFIAWYGLRLYFLWMLWRASRSVRQPVLRHLGLAAFLFHALVFNGQLVTNTAVGVFYWFLAGFAFLLPTLDRRWQTAQARPVPPRPRPLPTQPVALPQT